MAARTSSPPIDIITAIRDPNILGDALSPAQEAGLRTLYGLPVAGDQAALVARCTGRVAETREYREAAFICGRRSGKSDKLAANISIYESFFRQHRLSAGERGVCLLMAQNLRAAQVVSGYIKGKIERSPILSQHVLASRALELDLDNGITIAIHPSSFRAIRGLSVITAILDEAAFWFTELESANPDVEVLRAVRPATATHPNAKIIIVSSPYAKVGVLWDLWQNRHDDPEVLVWHAPTSLMNPTVPVRFLERERARDPETYAREYEAAFTDAVSSFIPGDAIEACVVRGRRDVRPVDRRRYHGAIDAAFKGDRFAICVVHVEAGKVVVDFLYGWEGTREAPLRLSTVLPEIQMIARSYRLYHIAGDQFGAEPLRHAFKGIHLTFEEVTFTNASKADLYGSLRALIVDRQIELLDHPESLKELRALELEALPGGTSRVGHPHRTGARDDFADAIALAVAETRAKRLRPIDDLSGLRCGSPLESLGPDSPSAIYGDWPRDDRSRGVETYRFRGW